MRKAALENEQKELERDGLYALIATAAGWTCSAIDGLTLPEAEELIAYWADHPPAHVLVP